MRYCRIQEVNESWKFSCWPIANCYSTLLGNIGISRSFTHSWLITGFITIVTRRVSLVERELLPLPEHLNSSPVFSGVGVTRSLVFCVMFCRSLLVLLYFFFWSLCCLSFDLQILITSLWYLVAIVLSFLRFTDSDYLPLVSFGHCVVFPSIYGFWLPPFGILWSLCCLSFDLRILITPLVSSNSSDIVDIDFWSIKIFFCIVTFLKYYIILVFFCLRMFWKRIA